MNALTALYGNAPFTDLVPVRDCAGILEALNDRTGGLVEVQQSISVEDVFDSLFTTGDYVALKTAQLNGNPLAVMAFATLDDAKHIGPGRVHLGLAGTAGLLEQLVSAGLLSEAGMAALAARAIRPVSLAEQTIGRQANINDVWESLE